MLHKHYPFYNESFTNLHEIMSKNVPRIETRKVQAVGKGGLYVVLPATWARKHDIEKGSEVLVIADNRIVIEPSNSERIEEAHKLVEKFIGGGCSGGK